ncbi:KAP family NTPase [Brevibacterium sp. CT2-23B]|uniref:KAP family NTPase n=1 Tax=Brevibacterium sp. CT2-23B TaxID=2729630 RepID=UPI0015520EEC|nr:KAP family NTPase [Brevibacterium sp. CT2-23B]
MSDEVWRDDPLVQGSQDAFGRLSYARRAAELIGNVHSFDSSAVVGLSGPWGSGKTSLIHMVIEELRANGQNWSVSWFNPWATSDVTGLLSEFYASLTEALPAKKSKNVKRALAVTASVAAPALDGIPVVGKPIGEAVRLVRDKTSQPMPWQRAFAEASHQLRELEQPILIVIDDVDRLQGDELLTLLKVVRLLGRFSGVQYLLAYDEETLHRNLVGAGVVSDSGTAERFMEKIVQYPLYLPPLTEHQQLARLNAGLDRVARFTSDDLATNRRLDGLRDCFTTLLTTPRAIDRFIAQLGHHLPLLPPDEIDDEDMQLLILMRVALPDLYAVIPRFRRQLLSGATGELKRDSQSDFEYEPFDKEVLVELVDVKYRDTARKLIVSLFPKVRLKSESVSYSSVRRQSVQNAEYFDRYFVMGIPDHDVSDEYVRVVFANALSGQPLGLIGLLTEKDIHLRSLAIGKCIALAADLPTGSSRITIADLLVGLVNRFSPDFSEWSNDDRRILEWIGDMLNSVKDHGESGLHLDVYRKLTRLSVQLLLWENVTTKLDRFGRGEKPAWYEGMASDLLRRATTDSLEHLKLGDVADSQAAIAYQLRFVLNLNPDPLRTEIADLLARQVIDLETIASRMVSARTMLGSAPDWQISDDIDQQLFERLVPAADDPWYHQTASDVDRRDLSWENKRRFVVGRIKQPAENSYIDWDSF